MPIPQEDFDAAATLATLDSDFVTIKHSQYALLPRRLNHQSHWTLLVPDHFEVVVPKGSYTFIPLQLTFIFKKGLIGYITRNPVLEALNIMIDSDFIFNHNINVHIKVRNFSSKNFVIRGGMCIGVLSCVTFS